MIGSFSFIQGITTYFSGNCCLEDAELAQKFLDSKVCYFTFKMNILTSMVRFSER